MKSFSQFLQESYLNEEEARQGSLMTRSGKPQDFRNPKKTPFTATDPTPTPASRRLPAGAPEAPKASPGQMEILEPKSTKVSGSQFRNAGEARQGSLFTKSGKPQNFTGGRTPFVGTDPVKATKRLPAAAPEAPKVSPGQQVIRQTSNPPTTKALPPGNTGGKLTKPINAIPDAMGKGAQDAARKQASNPKPPTGVKSTGLPPSGAKPTVPTAKPTVGKPPIGVKPSGVLGKLGKLAGPLGVAADVGLETMDQKSRGRKTGSALAMGATKAAGGLAGAKAGALTGAKFGSVLGPKGAAVGAAVGGLGGYLAGSGIAGKASETIAGATGKEKAAMATANRQKQAGTAVKGIGGSTSFSQKKPGGPAFMSTGSGAQRKTVQLAKTGVVQRGGQSVAGNLAFKGGKAVYKAGPSAQSLAKTSSNPLERVGRSLFAGAYKKSDAANAAKKLATARQSDAARNKALGVKAKPAG
jgi:hypothetical protein